MAYSPTLQRWPTDYKISGKIISDRNINSFTNRGGIVDYKGNSYIFLPYRSFTTVEVLAARHVEQFLQCRWYYSKLKLLRGPKPVGQLNPYKRVEAETMAWSEKCSISQNEKQGVYVSQTRMKGFIKVREVNFGDNSPKTFSASLAAGVDGGILEVRADSVKGAVLASIDLPRTGGWEQFKELSSKLNQEITGIHDIYLCFNGHNITAGRELFNFDYWIFKKE